MPEPLPQGGETGIVRVGGRQHRRALTSADLHIDLGDQAHWD